MGEENEGGEPIQSLLQDLSKQEKQILKQLFISNKMGKKDQVNWETDLEAALHFQQNVQR